MVTDWQLLSLKLNVRCSTRLLPVSLLPSFHYVLTGAIATFLCSAKKMSPNSAARRLTYSFLSDLCPLPLHFIASFAPFQFHSLDFPPCVGYFCFKHFFVRPAGQLLLSFKLPDTADIQRPLCPHYVSKIS